MQKRSLLTDKKIEQKTILITGATSGIGRSLTHLLSTHNTLILLARDAKKLNALAAPNCHVYVCDLTDLSAIKNTVTRISKTHSCIDLVIHNAAIQSTVLFTEPQFDINNIQQEVSTNFTAVCQLTYLLLPHLQKSAAGLIYFINSGLGLTPKKQSAVYCATKAALQSFAVSLQYQLAHTAITVKQAFLPMVDTPMTQGRGKKKLTADIAAKLLIKGLISHKKEIDIGKVKQLRILLRFCPFIAKRIMRHS